MKKDALNTTTNIGLEFSTQTPPNIREFKCTAEAVCVWGACSKNSVASKKSDAISREFPSKSRGDTWQLLGGTAKSGG